MRWASEKRKGSQAINKKAPNRIVSLVLQLDIKTFAPTGQESTVEGVELVFYPLASSESKRSQ
jgi:hypothetical protein